jgi:hypothetical protein
MNKILITKFEDFFLDDAYKLSLCFFSFFLFFLKMNQYPFSHDFLITYKFHYIIIGVYFLFLAPVLIEYYKKKIFPYSKIYHWVFFYIFLSIAFFFTTSNSAASLTEFFSRIIHALFLLTTFLLFSSIENDEKVKFIILSFLTLAILFNVLHFLFPFLFDTFISSRPSGTYSNPNQSAICITLGMILCLDRIPEKWREFFIISAGLGVFLTFSRGGVLCYIISVFVLLLYKKLNYTRMINYSIIIALIGYTLTLFGYENSENAMHTMKLHNSFFERYFSLNDKSTNSLVYRWTSLVYSFEDIKSHFFLGKGLGATRLPPYDHTGPHNIYLKHLVEGGIVGLITFPTLLGIIGLSVKESKHSYLIVFPLILGICGFFSHNILNEPHILILIALFFSSITKSEPVKNE